MKIIVNLDFMSKAFFLNIMVYNDTMTFDKKDVFIRFKPKSYFVENAKSCGKRIFGFITQMRPCFIVISRFLRSYTR